MEFYLTLLTIFTINILLSGDNALVIALASRNLPPKHKKMAILLGSVGAIVLLIVLTFIAVYLLQIPYLKLVGGALLLYIAIKLQTGEANEGEEIEAKSTLSQAVKTIIMADVIMSLDNIVAIAGVAKGNNQLIVLGLVTSIPIVIWGSNMISLLIKKFPSIIRIGAAILGYTAGEMIIADAHVAPVLLSVAAGLPRLIPLLCALVVLALGTILAQTKLGPAEFVLSDTVSRSESLTELGDDGKTEQGAAQKTRI